LKQYIIAYYY